MATHLVRRAMSRVPALSPVATATLLRSHASKAQAQQNEPASNSNTSQIYRWNSDSPQKPQIPSYDPYALAKPFTKFFFDREHNDTESSDIESYDDSKSPAISDYFKIKGFWLSRLREMCDLCKEPNLRPGAALTLINADKIVGVRHKAELALKFYNDTKLKNFKLVKVCKVTYTACTFCGLTFSAREDGSEECPLFRGVVYQMGMRTGIFCEIKNDDKVTLLPSDDDYVSSARAC